MIEIVPAFNQVDQSDSLNFASVFARFGHTCAATFSDHLGGCIENSRKRIMIKLRPTLIAVTCAAVIAGCSAQLDEARRAAQAGSAFDRALQTG